MRPEATPENNATITTRATCRACGERTLTSVLDLGTQYLPRFVAEPDATLPKAPLHLVRCASCGLLQLEHTVNPDLLYREFWYRSGVNDTMRRALDEVVQRGLRDHKGGVWCDIGANDGYLLSRVPKNFTRIAFEPALTFQDELKQVADRVVPDYFSDRWGDLRYDVITSIAMFYDVDEPGEFLEVIRKSLNQDGVWINQLNDAPTMMEQMAFDSICHEHLCYYDLPTLAALYKKHGLTVVGCSYNDINGGSMRVSAKRSEDVAGGPDSVVLGAQRVSGGDADAFASRVRRWRKVFRDLLYHWAEKPTIGTGVWAYGASTKGSTLLQYLDASDCFEGVADRNPRKHGLRMVGSWLPIHSEEEFRAAQASHAIVLPWAFKHEFDAREAKARAEGTAFVYPLPEIGVVV